MASAHFVHLAFDHHNIVVSSTHHKIHVSCLQLVESRIDDEFSIYTCHAHLRYGAVERHVRNRYRSRCGKAGKGIGHINAIRREKDDVDKRVGVVVVGEQRAQNPIDKTRREDFIIRGATFALLETARETPESRELLFIFNLEWHEVNPFAGLLGRHNCRKKHRIVHAQLNRSIGLLGKFASL